MPKLNWCIVKSMTIVESGNEYWVDKSRPMSKREATDKMIVYALNELCLMGWRVTSYQIYDDGRHICIEGNSGIQEVRHSFMIMTSDKADKYYESFNNSAKA